MRPYKWFHSKKNNTHTNMRTGRMDLAVAKVEFYDLCDSICGAIDMDLLHLLCCWHFARFYSHASRTDQSTWLAEKIKCFLCSHRRCAIFFPSYIRLPSIGRNRSLKNNTNFIMTVSSRVIIIITFNSFVLFRWLVFPESLLYGATDFYRLVCLFFFH